MYILFPNIVAAEMIFANDRWNVFGEALAHTRTPVEVGIGKCYNINIIVNMSPRLSVSSLAMRVCCWRWRFAWTFHRTRAQAMTASEEKVLVEHVKILAGFLKTRSALAIALERDPSEEEWAASVGLSTEELGMQVFFFATSNKQQAITRRRSYPPT